MQDMVCQGRRIGGEELGWINELVSCHKEWSRKRIAKEICDRWEWRTATGQAKTYAAREFLIKLERCGLVKLPPIRIEQRRTIWSRPAVEDLAIPEPGRIEVGLGELTPLAITVVSRGSEAEKRFRYYLAKHHYLGFKKTVGEHLQYLIRDCQCRDLACVLFGSAAWKAAERDRWIGWSADVRRCNLNFTTNNTRFLILPWVRVPHLASQILGRILRRVRADWQERYGHTIHLVETFVERDRFKGTCYKAANWLHVGQTRGRSRQDRYNNLMVPVKDIYVYPLIREFRKELTDAHA